MLTYVWVSLSLTLLLYIYIYIYIYIKGGLRETGGYLETEIQRWFLSYACCKQCPWSKKDKFPSVYMTHVSDYSLLLFIYLWLCQGFSPVAVNGACASGCSGFGNCGTWAQYLRLPGSRAQAQQLWSTGLAALWHVGSSPIRDGTGVSCIGRWALYHWAIRETLPFALKSGYHLYLRSPLTSCPVVLNTS